MCEWEVHLCDSRKMQRCEKVCELPSSYLVKTAALNSLDKRWNARNNPFKPGSESSVRCSRMGMSEKGPVDRSSELRRLAFKIHVTSTKLKSKNLAWRAGNGRNRNSRAWSSTWDRIAATFTQPASTWWIHFISKSNEKLMITELFEFVWTFVEWKQLDIHI